MIPLIYEQDHYYAFGDYLYDMMQLDVNHDIDMFKWIIGKLYFEYYFKLG